MFQKKSTLATLKNVLLTWALANRSLGYRQGMNELAGVLFFVRQEQVELVKAATDVQSQDYLTLMSEKYTEHDIFALLDRLMFTGLEGFFAHEEMIKKSKKGANKLPGDNRIYGFLADDYNVDSVELAVQEHQAADRQESVAHLQHEAQSG